MDHRPNSECPVLFPVAVLSYGGEIGRRVYSHGTAMIVESAIDSTLTRTTMLKLAAISSALLVLFIGCQPPDDAPRPTADNQANPPAVDLPAPKAEPDKIVTRDLSEFGIRVVIDLPATAEISEYYKQAFWSIDVSNPAWSKQSRDSRVEISIKEDRFKVPLAFFRKSLIDIDKVTTFLVDEPDTFVAQLPDDQSYRILHHFAVAGESYSASVYRIHDRKITDQILKSIRSIRETAAQKEANDRDAAALAAFTKAGGELQYGKRRWAVLSEDNFDEQVRCLGTLRFDVVSVKLQQASHALERIKILGNVNRLRALWVEGFAVNDDVAEEIAQLTNLEELEFVGCPTAVTHAGLRSLAALNNLRVLAVSGSNVRARAGPVDFLGTMTKLTELELYRFPINDANTNQIAELSKLRKLNLAGTQITDVGLVRLARLSDLEELNLSATKITDKGVRTLYGLTKLKKIRLPNTISKAVIVELGKLDSTPLVEQDG